MSDGTLTEVTSAITTTTTSTTDGIEPYRLDSRLKSLVELWTEHKWADSPLWKYINGAKTPTGGWDVEVLQSTVLELSAQSMMLQSSVESLAIVRQKEVVATIPSIVKASESVTRAVLTIRDARRKTRCLRERQVQMALAVGRMLAKRRVLTATIENADLLRVVLRQDDELQQQIVSEDIVPAAVTVKKLRTFVSRAGCQDTETTQSMHGKVQAAEDRLHKVILEKLEHVITVGGTNNWKEATEHMAQIQDAVNAIGGDILKELNDAALQAAIPSRLPAEVDPREATTFIADLCSTSWRVCIAVARWHRLITRRRGSNRTEDITVARTELWLALQRQLGGALSLVRVDCRTCTNAAQFLVMCIKCLRLCLEGFCFVERLDESEFNKKWYAAGLPKPWEVPCASDVKEGLKLRVKAYLLSQQAHCVRDLQVAVTQDGWTRLPQSSNCVEDIAIEPPGEMIRMAALYGRSKNGAFAPAVRSGTNPFDDQGNAMAEAAITAIMKLKQKTAAGDNEDGDVGDIVLSSSSRLLLRRIEQMLFVCSLTPFLLADLFLMVVFLLDLYVWWVSQLCSRPADLAMLTTDGSAREDIKHRHARLRSRNDRKSLARLVRFFHRIRLQRDADAAQYPFLVGEATEENACRLAELMASVSGPYVSSMYPLDAVESPGKSFGLLERCVAVEAASSLYQVAGWLFLHQSSIDAPSNDEALLSAADKPLALQLLSERRVVSIQLRDMIFSQLASVLLDLGELWQWVAQVSFEDTTKIPLPVGVVTHTAARFNELARRLKWVAGGCLPASTRAAFWTAAGSFTVRHTVKEIAAKTQPVGNREGIPAFYTGMRQILGLLAKTIAEARGDTYPVSDCINERPVEPWVDPTVLDKYIYAHQSITDCGSLLHWAETQEEFSVGEVQSLAQKTCLSDKFTDNAAKKKCQQELQTLFLRYLDPG